MSMYVTTYTHTQVLSLSLSISLYLCYFLISLSLIHCPMSTLLCQLQLPVFSHHQHCTVCLCTLSLQPTSIYTTQLMILRSRSPAPSLNVNAHTCTWTSWLAIYVMWTQVLFTVRVCCMDCDFMLSFVYPAVCSYAMACHCTCACVCILCTCVHNNIMYVITHCIWCSFNAFSLCLLARTFVYVIVSYFKSDV